MATASRWVRCRSGRPRIRRCGRIVAMLRPARWLLLLKLRSLARFSSTVFLALTAAVCRFERSVLYDYRRSIKCMRLARTSRSRQCLLRNPRTRDGCSNTLVPCRRHRRPFLTADDTALLRVVVPSSPRRLRGRHRAEQEEHERRDEDDPHQSPVISSRSSPIRLACCEPPRHVLDGRSSGLGDSCCGAQDERSSGELAKRSILICGRNGAEEALETDP